MVEWGIPQKMMQNAAQTLGQYDPPAIAKSNFCGVSPRVSQKNQKSEFWNVPYPSGFHRLDEPPEKISAL